MSDAAFQEYPKFLTHPDLPPVIAASAAAEADYIKRGFEPAGRSDPKAFEQRFSGAPGGYQPQQFPMWLTLGNGERVIVQDERELKLAKAGKIQAPSEYPLTISIAGGLQQITVHSREEHERLVGPLNMPAPIPAKG
jgi:hypothetical protein